MEQWTVWMVDAATGAQREVRVYASSRPAAMIKAENQYKALTALDAWS